MDATLMEQGYQLLFYGMGIVFFFLSLLVICVSCMSLFINKFFPVAITSDKPEKTEQKISSPRVSAHTDPHLLKVIALAVEQHREHQS